MAAATVQSFNMYAKVWNRLIDMNGDRLTEQIFLYDYEKRTNNWTSDIKSMLLELRISENVFENCTLCDIEEVNRLCENLMITKWQTAVESKPKLSQM